MRVSVSGHAASAAAAEISLGMGFPDVAGATCVRVLRRLCVDDRLETSGLESLRVGSGN